MKRAMKEEDDCASGTAVRSSNHEEALSFNKKGLFIGGCPKSGTTLLLSLLDNHPQLVVLPEETFYLENRKRYRGLKTTTARLEYLLQHTDLKLLAEERFEPTRECTSADARIYGHFDFPRFMKLARDFASARWIDDSLLFTEMLRAYAMVLGIDWRRCVRWVEKSTSNEAHLEVLNELFPTARLVQVVRDPRAVFASRKKRLVSYNGYYTKAHRLVREWNCTSRQIPSLRRDPLRFLVLRYEDLVKNPEAALEQVCRLGGFEFTAQLFQPTRAGQEWEGNSSFQTAFSGIDNTTVDQWRHHLTEHEIWWIEFHCRKGMALAGYSLQTSGRFSLSRWLRRLPNESRAGYLRARRASLCQSLGWLEECRYHSDN